MMLRMRIMLSRLGNRIWGMFCPVIFGFDAIIYFKNLNLGLLLLIRDDKLALSPADPLVLGDCAFSYLVLLLYEHYWAFCYVIIFGVIAFLSNDFVLSHAYCKK